MHPKFRVTGILIKDKEILIVQQKVTESQHRCWSLPGGTLELNESIADCLIREISEETGLDIKVEDLLYICDRIQDGRHVVHITFQIEQVGGTLRIGHEPENEANPIQDVKMVPLSTLTKFGFSAIFQELALSGFKDRGKYKGAVENIGL